jgi:hypothetical protein
MNAKIDAPAYSGLFSMHINVFWPTLRRLGTNDNKRSIMLFENPCKHNGYVITGNAFELAPGQWQSQLLVERDGFAAEGMGISPTCTGARAAEQQALRAGRRMVDGAGFSLHAASPTASNSTGTRSPVTS